MRRTSRPGLLAAAVLLLGALSTPGAAQDEPELVECFTAPHEARSSYAIYIARTDSVVYAVDRPGPEFGPWLRLWRLRGQDDPPERVAHLGLAGRGWGQVTSGSLTVGETVLLTRWNELWRIEPRR